MRKGLKNLCSSIRRCSSSDFLTFPSIKGRCGLIEGIYLCNSGSTCCDPQAGSNEDKPGGLAMLQLSDIPCRKVGGGAVEVTKSLWMQCGLGSFQSMSSSEGAGWRSPSPHLTRTEDRDGAEGSAQRTHCSVAGMLSSFQRPPQFSCRGHSLN